KEVEIANLKAQLSLKEVEATEAIRLHNQVSTIEAVEVARVSELESTTCSGLSDQVSGYELFKEQYEAVQDEHVKVGLHEVSLITRVHYHFGDIYWSFIDKGMQTGLVAGIYHEKAERGLDDIAAYDPSVEAKYISPILAFCGLDFDLLSQQESQKDASIANIISLLHLEGPSVKTMEKIKEGALSRRLSMDVMVDPMSFENLIGEASTLGVSTTAAATTTLAISVTTANVSSIPPISVADYGVLDVEPHYEAPNSLKIVFENEDLETTPEHPTAS
nr:hypothetical protein [Tanacetum cinerariifolium]